ncbi:SusC/RagA family TonB-linked outer membrane protein [Phnomibacter ginsenosidimutans]|uniref:SusC/RagA family TonB-linked outer membrane protein n=1 Tax=Phnomibacter ginsenosidimutans TaxID=2676868 RepID=A0A6I6G6I3_9BACT|nr:SusC/RagA family TonB-linked outer membrane protein [Phnomibacter ginsenosidimutans]QGW28296.1 SusC/RagA family TonB-linked outer membrane protein [Phnomibacter ginsenosidimutans]
MKRWMKSATVAGLLCTMTAGAQLPDRGMLRGQVLDTEDRKPLPGATILQYRDRQQVTADAAGRFVVPVRWTGDTLLVSFTGYAPLIRYIGRRDSGQELRLMLEPLDATLAAVTVTTGMQELRRERSTGSFDRVGQALLNRGVSADVLSRLEGVASSVLTSTSSGGNRSISVRGVSTLRQSMTDPLVILDNFPYAGDVSNINPEDVLDVTILKDAAAASIWGARAGNGVIVIRTKKAGMQQPLRVQVNSQYTQTAVPRLMDLPVMGTADFIATEQWLFEKGYFNAALNNTTTRPVVSPVVELLQRQRLGLVDATTVAATLEGWAARDVRRSFLEHVYQPAGMQQHHVQLTMGGPQLSMLLSGSYNRQSASLQGDGQERLTGRLELTGKPNKRLELGAGMLFTGTKQWQRNAGGYGELSIGGGKSTAIYPYYAFYDADGVAVPYEKDYRQGYTDTAGGGLLAMWKYYPLAERELQLTERGQQHVVLRMHARLQLHRYVQAELRWQQEQGWQQREQAWDGEAYYVRNLRNRFSSLQNGQVTSALPAGGILDREEGRQLLNQWRLQLNTDVERHDWGLHAIAGAELRQMDSRSAAGRYYGYDAQTLSSAQVNYLQVYPLYGNVGAASQLPVNQAQSGLADRFVSVYGNAGLQWRRQYQLNMSVRKDAANLLGVGTNKRGVPLFSVGLGWQPTAAAWWRWQWVDRWQLRATYGSSGNVDNSVSPLTTITYYPAAGSIVNQPYAGIRTPANAALRWEQVYQWNVGMDVAMWQQRITGSVEWYEKRSKDLLIPVVPDPTTGQSLVTMNAGRMRVRGVDVQLMTALLRGKTELRIDWLLNWNKSLITEYPLSSTVGNTLVGMEQTINPRAGFPAYGVYSYVMTGLDAATGNPVGRLDGMASQQYGTIISSTVSDSLWFHGSSRPDFFGSVRPSVGRGGWKLSVNVLWKWGHYYRNRSVHYQNLFASWVTHADWAKRWQQPGDELRTQVPSMLYPNSSLRDNFYSNSTVLVERANSIRLQDVQVSYDLPKRWCKRLQLQQCNWYGLWQPGILLYKANSRGVDPEWPDGLRQPLAWTVGLRVGM